MFVATTAKQFTTAALLNLGEVQPSPEIIRRPKSGVGEVVESGCACACVASCLQAILASHCACERRRFDIIYCVEEQAMALRNYN
jgi:hypothetical protein